MRLHLSTSRGPARSLHKTSVREEGGAELVEAALVISFLVMLLLGVIVMARAYNVAETINRAAREGARFAVTPTCASCGNTFPTDDEVRAVVNASLTVSALDPTLVQPNPINVQRNVVLNTGSVPEEVGIVISFNYPFQFLLPFTSLNMTTISLSTQVQMRQE